jgi:hypothetical protein
VNELDYDSMQDMISDCDRIPAGLRGTRTEVPAPRAAVSWTVDDANYKQVEDLDPYA